MTVLIATIAVWVLVIPIGVVLTTLAISDLGSRRLRRAARTFARSANSLPARVLHLRSAEPIDGPASSSLTA